MKRQILTLTAVLVLVLAGAVFAQSSQNTTAPGPTIQKEPGLTNNNLPNPGNPLPLNEPAQEPAPTAEPAPETQVDTTTTPADSTTTTPTTLNETNVEPESQETATTDTSGTYTETADDTDALPATASELPTVALIGLLALGAAFLVRARRQA